MVKNLIRLFILGMVVISFATSGTVSAQGGSSDFGKKVDAYIEETRKAADIPNAAVSVVKDGKIIYSKNYGEGITDTSTFIIGSMSKSMTAYATMLLVQDGMVNLDDSAAKYFPDYAIKDSKVTIKNLLNHTSGFGEYESYGYIGSRISSVSDMTVLFKDVHPTNENLGTFEYSSVNYYFLGLLIERVSHMSYAQFMKQRVFEPLGMAGASAGENHNIIQGYTSRFGFTVKDTVPYSPGDAPAGYIHATADDVAKFLLAQNSGYPLNKTNNAQMFSERVSQFGASEPYYFGFGWSIFDDKSRPVDIAHGGTVPGFNSAMTMRPSKNDGVVVLINKEHPLDDDTSLNTLAMVEQITTLLEEDKTPKGMQSYEKVRGISILAILIALVGVLIYAAKCRVNKRFAKIKFSAGILCIVLGLGIAPALLYASDVNAIGVFQAAWVLAPDMVGAGFTMAIGLVATGTTLVIRMRSNLNIKTNKTKTRQKNILTR